MKPHHSFLLWVICASGPLLIVMAIAGKWHVRWPKIALFLTGIIVEVDVLFELLLERLDPWNRWLDLLTHLHSTLGGIALGLLVALGLFMRFDSRQTGYASNAKSRTI